MIIDKYFEELFDKVNRERIKASRPEYEKLYEAESEELSIDGADEIERASWQTTARLIVEESEEREEKEDSSLNEEISQIEKSDIDTDFYGLSAEEIEFLSFAYEENYEKMRELSSAMGSFPDAIADKINEAFSDNFGDVVLSDVGEGYAVISDYREDIKKWLTKTVK